MQAPPGPEAAGTQKTLGWKRWEGETPQPRGAPHRQTQTNPMLWADPPTPCTFLPAHTEPPGPTAPTLNTSQSSPYALSQSDPPPAPTCIDHPQPGPSPPKPDPPPIQSDPPDPDRPLTLGAQALPPPPRPTTAIQTKPSPPAQIPPPSLTPAARTDPPHPRPTPLTPAAARPALSAAISPPHNAPRYHVTRSGRCRPPALALRRPLAGGRSTEETSRRPPPRQDPPRTLGGTQRSLPKPPQGPWHPSPHPNAHHECPPAPPLTGVLREPPHHGC